MFLLLWPYLGETPHLHASMCSAVRAAGGLGLVFAPGVRSLGLGSWGTWELTAKLWSKPQPGVRGWWGRQQGLPRAAPQTG